MANYRVILSTTQVGEQEAKPIQASVIILDVDNTLFDWFEFWANSFKAMVNSVIGSTDIARDTLLQEIKAVHTRHGTSEYAFLLQELPSLQKVSKLRRDVVIADAIRSFREAREKTLTLYPGVMETLLRIKSLGTVTIAFTESQKFYTIHRLKRFGLDGVLDAVYSVEDHDLPDGLQVEAIRSKPKDSYVLLKTAEHTLKRGTRKPDPEILLSILNDYEIVPERAVYVGDSLHKDVLMAQRAGVADVHAAYGRAHKREDYELLRSVSHWTPEEMENEKTSEIDIKASTVLRAGFAEVLERFEFHG